MGIASTNTGVCFALQDTRNDNANTGAEASTAAVKLPGAAVVSALPSPETPVWPFIMVGAVLDMGVTMAVIAVVVRSRSRRVSGGEVPSSTGQSRPQ